MSELLEGPVHGSLTAKNKHKGVILPRYHLRVCHCKLVFKIIKKMYIINKLTLDTQRSAALEFRIA